MATILDGLTIDGTTGEIIGLPDNGRDSERYAWSDEDLAYSVPAYEAALNGGRPVQNLFSSTEDLTNAAWLTGGSATVDDFETISFSASASDNIYQSVSTSGHNVIISADIKCAAGTEVFRLRAGSLTNASANITATTTWQRFSWPVVANGPVTGVMNGTDASARTLNVRKLQVEDATGRADTTTPSEYAENGTGNGYAVYGTENGNSVASNVVTEGVGAALSPVPRLSHNPALTNSQTYSNDQSNAVYTATNVTVGAQDEDGLDAHPSGSCTLTATAVNGTVIANAVTAASANQVTRWFIKRKTGTGTIEITTDNGGTWTDVTSDITTAFSEVLAEKAAVTNPQIGIRIATSGDAVVVGNAEIHTNTNLENVRGCGPIFTTTVAVSVTADEYSYPNSYHSDTELTYACEWTPGYSASEATGDQEIITLGTAPDMLYHDATNGDIESTDGTNTSTKAETTVAGTTYDLEVAYSTSGNSLQVTVDAAAGSAESYDGAFPTGTKISLFRNSSFAQEMFAFTVTEPEATSIPVFAHHYMHNIG